MKIGLLLILLLFSTELFAAQNITVYGSGSSKTKIAVSGIDDQEIMQEVQFDLELSGELLINNLNDLEKIITNNAPFLLKVKITQDDLQSTIFYTLTQNFTNKLLLSHSIKFNTSNKRKVVHMMNNAIYQAITHNAASFTSKIAVITKVTDQYQLIISDYDGYNAHAILKTKTPISSLAWSPDNSNIAYVFYGYNKPVVYVQNISTGARTLVAAFDGSNSSPTFLNNNKMLVTLSKDEVSHIYEIDLSPYTINKPATPIVIFGEIDTEADVSNDGKIAFTSDYEGDPQIFITDLNHKTTNKLTNMLGKHLTTARFAKDSNKIVLIKKENGFKTFLYDLKAKVITCISEGGADLAPSFAPNSKLVLYSSNDVLYISSTVHNKISALAIDHQPYDEVIDQRWSN
jgi:TolB protein